MEFISFKRLTSHRLFRNSFALFILQIVNYLAPLLVLPYLSRTLRVEEFGIVAITLAAIQLSQIITDYGFTYYAPYKISTNRENSSVVSELISRIFSAKIVLVLLVIGAALVFLSASSEFNTYAPYFIFASLAVVAQAYQPIWFFQGIEKMKKVTIYTTTAKMSYVVLVYLFINQEGDGAYVILAWSAAQALGTYIAIREMQKEGYRLQWRIKGVFTVLLQAQGFFWARLSAAMYSSSNSLIVGWLFGPVQSAYYNVSEQIFKVCIFAPVPINQAIYPYMAREKNWRVFFGVLFGVSICMILGSIFVYVFAPDIIRILFGEQYAAATDVVRILMIAVVLNYFSANLGYPLFAALGRANLANGPIILCAILYLTYIGWLYLTGNGNSSWIAWGVVGVEVVMFISNIVLALIVVLQNKRKVGSFHE